MYEEKKKQKQNKKTKQKTKKNKQTKQKKAGKRVVLKEPSTERTFHV